MVGIRLLCIALGWAFGALIFGTEAVWLWDIQSFIWCGMAGGMIGILLTTKQEDLDPGQLSHSENGAPSLNNLHGVLLLGNPILTSERH